MMQRSIKNLQAGRGITIYGMITEVDQAPMTVSVGADKRLAHIYHFTLTDEETSIQVTAWDRVSEFTNFKLGEKMMVTNVTVKRVTGFFAEYGHYAANFGRGSVAARVPGDVDVSNWQKVSVRLPSQVGTPPTQTLEDPQRFAAMTSSSNMSESTNDKKRPRESMAITPPSTACIPTCDQCDAPAEPFCETTGRPHDARCPLCKKVLTRTLFCCKTGLPHDISL